MSAWGWKSQEHLATRRETASVQRQEEQKERKKVAGGGMERGSLVNDTRKELPN